MPEVWITVVIGACSVGAAVFIGVATVLLRNATRELTNATYQLDSTTDIMGMREKEEQHRRWIYELLTSQIGDRRLPRFVADDKTIWCWNPTLKSIGRCRFNLAHRNHPEANQQTSGISTWPADNSHWVYFPPGLSCLSDVAPNFPQFQNNLKDYYLLDWE